MRTDQQPPSTSHRLSHRSPAGATPLRHARLARGLALAACSTVAFVVCVSVPRAAAATPSWTHTASRLVSENVASAGTYEVVVSVRARGKHERRVRVSIDGRRARTIIALPWWGPRLYYTLRLTQPTLTVRAIDAAPAVAVRVTMRLKPAPAAARSTTPSTAASLNAPPTPTPATQTASAQAASAQSAPATPAAPAPAPPAAPSPPPAAAANPYTNLVWEDNFAQDYVNGGSVPKQLPNPSNWSLDSWSGCGPGTLSTPAQNGSPSADQNVYLTAQGLAITALQTGPNSYSAAQLDSVGPQSDPKPFAAGATIEASIALPPGQGLCPAFWMLADSPVAGATTPGEIDVLEAPSFGPLPTFGYFDLHGPTGAQEFESSGAPSGWNPTQFHTYGVIWTPTSITWTIDGVAYATATQASVPASSWAAYQTGAFRLIFDLAVGGWPCSAGSCSPPSSATMYVQWVKVFN